MKYTFQNGIILGALCALAVFFVVGALQRRAARRRAFGGLDLADLYTRLPQAAVHSKHVQVVGGADGKPRWEMREVRDGKEVRKSGEGLPDMLKEVPELGLVGQFVGNAFGQYKALATGDAPREPPPKIEELPSSCEPTTPVIAAP